MGILNYLIKTPYGDFTVNTTSDGNPYQSRPAHYTHPDISLSQNRNALPLEMRTPRTVVRMGETKISQSEILETSGINGCIIIIGRLQKQDGKKYGIMSHYPPTRLEEQVTSTYTFAHKTRKQTFKVFYPDFMDFTKIENRLKRYFPEASIDFAPYKLWKDSEALKVAPLSTTLLDPVTGEYLFRPPKYEGYDERYSGNLRFN